MVFKPVGSIGSTESFKYDAALLSSMGKPETHQIVIYEGDFKWLKGFVEYGEPIAEALNRVRKIIESKKDEPEPKKEYVELVTPPGALKCDLSEES